MRWQQRLPDHHQSTFERFSVTMSLLTVVAIYLLKLMIILMVHGDSTHRRRGGGGGGASVEMLAWKFWVVDSMYLPCHGVKLSVIFFLSYQSTSKTKYNTECLTPRAKQAKFAELYVMRMSSEFRRGLELCSSCLILVFVGCRRPQLNHHFFSGKLLLIVFF